MMSTFLLCLYYVLHHKDKLTKPEPIVAYPFFKKKKTSTTTKIENLFLAQIIFKSNNFLDCYP